MKRGVKLLFIICLFIFLTTPVLIAAFLTDLTTHTLLDSKRLRDSYPNISFFFLSYSSCDIAPPLRSLSYLSNVLTSLGDNNLS